MTKILYTAIDGDLDIEDLLKYGDHEEGDEEEEDFEPEEDDQFTACNKAIIRQHKMRHSKFVAYDSYHKQPSKISKADTSRV